MIRLNSLTFRLVAGTMMWCLIAFIVVGLVLSSIVRRAAERTLDERLTIVADNLMAMANVDADGRFTLMRPLTDSRFQRVYSGWYWQIDALSDDPDRENHLRTKLSGGEPEMLDADQDGDGRIVVARSRSLWDGVLELPGLPALPGVMRSQITGPDGQELRVLTREISLPGIAAPFQVAVAADLSDMHKVIADFNVMLIWSLGLMGIVLIVILVVQIRIGLLPLGRIEQDLADIRSGKAQRLSGDGPAEIAPLAHELNKVLDHNRHVVERAHTQVGNLAHALKTPLSVLANASKSRSDFLSAMVHEQTDIMRAQVERYLARARTAASAEVLGARCDVRPVIDGLVRTLAKINRERGIVVTVECPQGAAFRGECADFEEIAGNLLDNAFKWADSRVAVTVLIDGPVLTLKVCDDGPGLPEDKREEALKRGARLDETVPGSGLGLSIVGEIAEAYRGDIILKSAELGGLAAHVTLPSAGAPEFKPGL